MSTEQRSRLEKQLRRAREDLAGVERLWRRVPWLGAGVVLALPAAFIWGFAGVVVVLVMVLLFVGIAMYMTLVRRFEFRRDVERLQKTLSELGGTGEIEGAPSPPAG